MKINKFLSVNLGVIYSLFSLGLGGEDLGLPSVLTMRTIALAILIFCFCLVFVQENNFGIRINQYFYFTIIVFILIFMWILLSYLFSPYQDLVRITDVLAWLAIPICMLFTSKITKKITLKIFITTIVYSQFIALSMVYIWSMFNVGDLTNFLAVRLFINDNLVIGLNRFLNGVMFLNVISISIILGIYKSNKVIYLLSLMNVIFSFYLSFISGSRQSLVAFLLSVLIVIIINRYMKGIKGINFKGIMFTIIFIILIVNLIQIEGVNRWVEERFIDKTTEQFTTGDIRTDIYEDAINDVKENLLFGTGPGTYNQVSYLGMATHNGYLYMMNNFGVVPVILLAIFFLSLIFKGISKKSIITENKKKETFVVIFSSFLVFIFMNLFNDLITMLSFWMAVVIIIDCFDSKTVKY